MSLVNSKPLLSWINLSLRWSYVQHGLACLVDKPKHFIQLSHPSCLFFLSIPMSEKGSWAEVTGHHMPPLSDLTCPYVAKRCFSWKLNPRLFLILHQSLGMLCPWDRLSPVRLVSTGFPGAVQEPSDSSKLSFDWTSPQGLGETGSDSSVMSRSSFGNIWK